MCNENKKSAVSHREIKKSINIYVIILKIFFVFYDLHLSAKLLHLETCICWTVDHCCVEMGKINARHKYILKKACSHQGKLELETSGFNKRGSQINVFTRSKHFTQPILQRLTETCMCEWASCFAADVLAIMRDGPLYDSNTQQQTLEGVEKIIFIWAVKYTINKSY